MILPLNIDPKEFDKVYRLQFPLWQQAILQICGEHDIPQNEIVPFADGSNLVASVADKYVFKIFPPFHRHQWESEYRFLAALQEKKTSIPIPKLVVSGKRPDQWFYVVITKLPGTTLENVWHQCSDREKSAILEDIGRTMSVVHQLPIGQLKTIEPNWDSFVTAQLSSCLRRHTRLGMPIWFLREVETFVQQNLPLLPSDFRSVILTGEYTPFNLMAEPGKSGWQLSGMIDFGDAMVGYREYDLLGPSLFLAQGNPDFIRSLFLGYGYSLAELTPELRRRLMLLQILHRYSNFETQLRIPGWKVKVQSVSELGQLIWPF